MEKTKNKRKGAACCAQAIIAALLLAMPAAAQDSAKAAPEKIAVHAFGASDAGINKALGSKLLVELVQSGKYAEIQDHHAFQDELAKAGNSGSSMAQAAKRRGADIVCAVSIVEVFGAYSITARMQKASDSQVLKTASLDRSLKSLEDLSKASKDIAAQLLGLPVAEAAPEPAPAAVPWNIFRPDSSIKPVPAAALPKPAAALPKPKPIPKAPSGISSTCLAEFMFVSEKYEMAELVKKLGVEAVKVKAQSKAPLQFLLGPGPDDKVTDAGMTVGCLKAFPESASEAQALLKDLAVYAAFKLGKDFAESSVRAASMEDEEDKGAVSFGVRAGINFSHFYAEYKNGYSKAIGTYDPTFGVQLGMVLDIAANEVFHIQPGIMYIGKGARDESEHYYDNNAYVNNAIQLHYLELPLLVSLKFSALRINAGPYYGICIGGNSVDDNDFGLSMGIGFDISKFYIGTFYDYGLTSISSKRYFEFYNRTLGFNLGVNL